MVMLNQNVMKHIIYPLLLLSIVLASCNRQNNAETIEENVDTTLLSTDSTLYGRCIDAAMTSFGLITEKGDTLTIQLETGDTIANVQGGLYDGDKLAVMAYNSDEGLFAEKVINITSLRGRWISIDKNFEIKDDGVVESNVEAETNPYTSWSIYNGLLVLSGDTFVVLELGADSLYLENKQGIFAYKRL